MSQMCASTSMQEHITKHEIDCMCEEKMGGLVSIILQKCLEFSYQNKLKKQHLGSCTWNFWVALISLV